MVPTRRVDVPPGGGRRRGRAAGIRGEGCLSREVSVLRRVAGRGLRGAQCAAGAVRRRRRPVRQPPRRGSRRTAGAGTSARAAAPEGGGARRRLPHGVHRRRPSRRDAAQHRHAGGDRRQRDVRHHPLRRARQPRALHRRRRRGRAERPGDQLEAAQRGAVGQAARYPLMLRWLVDIPIRRKLLVITVLATLVALLLAGSVIVGYEVYTYRHQITRQTAVQADILAASVTASLEFNDPKAAREYLDALHADPDIVAAAIYAADGSLFARYARAGADGVAVPKLQPAPSQRFEDDHLVVAWPVKQGTRL